MANADTQHATMMTTALWPHEKSTPDSLASMGRARVATGQAVDRNKMIGVHPMPDTKRKCEGAEGRQGREDRYTCFHDGAESRNVPFRASGRR